MNIVHLTPHVRNVGNGIVNVTVDLACAQADAGHSVTVISAGGDFDALLAAHGVARIDMPLRLSLRSFAPLTLRLRRALVRLRPDVVHVHLMAGAVMGAALRIGLHYRLISTVHTAFRRGTFLMGLADEVIAVSSATATALRSQGVASRKIHLIFNAPLDSPRRSSDPTRLEEGLSHPAIVTVAGLYWRKGIDILIAAFERIADLHPTASLAIAGEGPDGDRFRALARESRHAARIRFLGLLKDPRALLDAADIFVLASREDPFPLVIAEARAAECAVVASAVDGIPEALGGGRYGQLFPSEDVGRLAEIVEGLVSDGDALISWKGAASEDLAYYRLPRLIRDVDAVYAAALDRKK